MCQQVTWRSPGSHRLSQSLLRLSRRLDAEMKALPIVVDEVFRSPVVMAPEPLADKSPAGIFVSSEAVAQPPLFEHFGNFAHLWLRLFGIGGIRQCRVTLALVIMPLLQSSKS